jgi:hypothetical protein
MNSPDFLRPAGMTKSAPRSRRILFLAVGYLLSLVLRLPALLFAPRGFFYNVDELAMTLRSLDRFLGVPAVSLAWPGSTLTLLSLPAFLADFLVASHLPTKLTPALSLFARYLSHAYADPRHSILLMRWIVALVSSLCPLLAYYVGVRLSKSRLMGFACALLVSFQPTFYQQSVMATGDAVSITLGLAAILCLLRQTDLNSATLAGFLFSGALAAKITVASLILLPLLLILGDGSLSLRERGASLLRFCGSLIVGFMLWCPYVWTDPMRLAKAVLGNATKPGSAPSLNVFLSLWSDAMGITFSVLTVLALAGGICLIRLRQHTRLVAASFAALVAILTPLFLHATRAFPRYFLPILPCVLILLAAGFRIFDSERTLVGRWRLPALALMLLAGLTMCGETCARELSLRGPDELASAVNVIQSLPKGTTLFLPDEAIWTFRVPLSQRARQEMLEHARRDLESEDRAINFAELRGIPPVAAEVFLWSFNEDEQAAYRRAAAICALESRGSMNVVFYYPPYDPRNLDTDRTSVATMDLGTAIQAMQRTNDGAILVPFAVMSLGKPLWSGKRWHWYRR